MSSIRRVGDIQHLDLENVCYRATGDCNVGKHPAIQSVLSALRQVGDNKSAIQEVMGLVRLVNNIRILLLTQIDI